MKPNLNFKKKLSIAFTFLLFTTLVFTDTSTNVKASLKTLPSVENNDGVDFESLFYGNSYIYYGAYNHAKTWNDDLSNVTIYTGATEWDEYTTPILWEIIGKEEDDSITLLSKYIIDTKKFDDSTTGDGGEYDNDYSNSLLKDYLNDLSNNTDNFISAEQDAMKTVDIKTATYNRNGDYVTSKTTPSQTLYIPSGIFKGNDIFWESGESLSTDYKLSSKLATLKNSDVPMHWWLRNPDSESSLNVLYSSNALANGKIGIDNSRHKIGVRPALKINPSSIILAHEILSSSDYLETPSAIGENSSYYKGEEGKSNFKLTVLGGNGGNDIGTLTGVPTTEQTVSSDTLTLTNLTASEDSNEYSINYKIVGLQDNKRKIFWSGSSSNFNSLDIDTQKLPNGDYTAYVWLQKNNMINSNETSSINSFTLKVNRDLPVLSDVFGTYVNNSTPIITQSSKKGYLYLVSSHINPTKSDFELAVNSNKAIKSKIEAKNLNTVITGTDLDDGTYKLYAVDESFNPCENPATIFIDSTKPTIDTITATATSTSSVALSVVASDTDPNPLSYKWMFLDNSTLEYVDILDETDSNCTHTNLSPNTTYYYKVTVTDSAENTVISNEISTTTNSITPPVFNIPTGFVGNELTIITGDNNYTDAIIESVYDGNIVTPLSSSGTITIPSTNIMRDGNIEITLKATNYLDKTFYATISNPDAPTVSANPSPITDWLNIDVSPKLTFNDGSGVLSEQKFSLSQSDTPKDLSYYNDESIFINTEGTNYIHWSALDSLYNSTIPVTGYLTYNIDKTAPKINNDFEYVSITPNQITIKNTATDELSGLSLNNAYAFGIGENAPSTSDWQTNETKTFSNLLDNTTYNFWLKTKDNAGNESDWTMIGSEKTLEKVATFTSITANPTILQSTGGEVTLTVTGTNLDIANLKILNGTTELTKTFLENNTIAIAKFVLPSNSATNPFRHTFKAVFDNVEKGNVSVVVPNINNYSNSNSSPEKPTNNENFKVENSIKEQIKNKSKLIKLELTDTISSVSISKDIISEIIKNEATISVNSNSLSILISPDSLISSGILGDYDVYISVTPVDKNFSNNFSDSTQTMITDIFEIKIKEKNKEKTKFLEPLKLTYTFTDENLPTKQLENLTFVRFIDEKTKINIGGEYDSSTKSISTYTNSLSKYGVMNVSDLKKIVMKIDSKEYFVDGVAKTMDVSPIILDDVTLIPIRFMAEAYGADVLWNEKTQTAKISLNEKNIYVTIGRKSDGMSIAPKLIDGRTMVPLRYIIENLEGNVIWESESKTIKAYR